MGNLAGGIQVANPVDGWIELLIQRRVLTKKVDNQIDATLKNRRISFFISIFIIVSAAKYFSQIFVATEGHHDFKTYYGCLFHAFGFAGRVLLVVAASVVFQPGCTRLVLLILELRHQTDFIQDLKNFDSSRILSRKTKDSFDKNVRLIFKFVTFFGQVVCYTACGITAMMGIYMAWRDPRLIYCLIWSFWVIVQWVVVYFIWPDMLILRGFWLILLRRVSLVVQQVTQELTNLTVNALRSRSNDKQVNCYLELWFLRYHKMIRILNNFDIFSRQFLFNMSAVSSVSCAGFLYGGVTLDNMLIQLAMIPLVIAYVGTSVTLLYAGTIIHSQGKRLHIVLNGSMISLNNRLSINSRFVFKSIIDQTGSLRYPSVALTTLGGVPYTSLEFVKFVSSFVTLMVILIDFSRALI